MRAGKLDKTITIERASETLNEARTVVETWAPVATVRAEIVSAELDENDRASGTAADTAVTFRIRYLAGITTADRVAYAGQHLDIRHMREIGRRHGLELRTVARGASS